MLKWVNCVVGESYLNKTTARKEEMRNWCLQGCINLLPHAFPNHPLGTTLDFSSSHLTEGSLG